MAKIQLKVFVDIEYRTGETIGSNTRIEIS